jgi:DNA invertase Pin-like site-specific DNA recombinase
MGEIIGYARVSSTGQSLEVQKDKLIKAGCRVPLYEEKRSGANAYNRPRLQECLSYVRDGDQLVVTKLDRLARSLLDLAKIADLLKQKHVDLRVLDQHIDTSRADGRLLFGMLGAFSEFELALRAERQADGIAKALAKGIKFGRKPALDEKQRQRIIALWSEEEFSAQQLAERFNVGIATIYRVIQPIKER